MKRNMSLAEFFQKINQAVVTLKSSGHDLNEIEIEFHVADRSEGTTVIAGQLDKMNFNLLDKNSKVEIELS